MAAQIRPWSYDGSDGLASASARLLRKAHLEPYIARHESNESNEDPSRFMIGGKENCTRLSLQLKNQDSSDPSSPRISLADTRWIRMIPIGFQYCASGVRQGQRCQCSCPPSVRQEPAYKKEMVSVIIGKSACLLDLKLG